MTFQLQDELFRARTRQVFDRAGLLQNVLSDQMKHFYNLKFVVGRERRTGHFEMIAFVNRVKHSGF